jgi:hypothetical protein
MVSLDRPVPITVRFVTVMYQPESTWNFWKHKLFQISYAYIVINNLRFWVIMKSVWFQYHVNALIPASVSCSKKLTSNTDASCRLPTSVAQFRSQVRSCGIYCGQSGTGEGVLRVLRFPLPIHILPTVSYSSIIQGWYNKSNSGLSTKLTQSHPIPRN